MIRVGLIGCGEFGTRHAAAWRTVSGASLRAVYDPDMARARAAAGTDARVFDRLRDLLDCVDAVSIATPAHLHTDMVRRALDAGLHVLVEKPFGVCPRLAEELAFHAKAKDRVLTVGYLERFHPQIDRAIASRPLPKRLEVDRINCRRPRDATVGLILDLMSHDIDLTLRWFGGAISEIQATASVGDGGIMDEAVVEMIFADGQTTSLRSSWRGTSRQRAIRMLGGDGYTHIDLLDNGHGVDLLQAELSSFADAVRGGIRNPMSGAEAARTLSVARRIADALRVTEAAS